MNYATDNMDIEFSTKWDVNFPLTSCLYKCIFNWLDEYDIYNSEIKTILLAYASSETSPKFYESYFIINKETNLVP